ncbi:MAG: polysaccharide biosynthesis/export family protein [Akkermansiaceae bacterium]|nr:polysaccharide biosynthesis/export family protein [Akkermansiaceae bacterium]
MRLLKYVKLLGVVFGVFSLSAVAHAGVIKSGDTVIISLKGVPASEQAKVNGEYQVRDSGNIRVPIINVNIRALGKRPEDVERSIEEAFKTAEIYVAPTISVQVRERGDIREVVSVGGEVARPGAVQYRPEMTVIQAIQQAGDRKVFASKYFYLLRKDSQTGKTMRYKYNIKTPSHQNLKVFPGDTITIPEKGGLIDTGRE